MDEVKYNHRKGNEFLNKIQHISNIVEKNKKAYDHNDANTKNSMPHLNTLETLKNYVFLNFGTSKPIDFDKEDHDDEYQHMT